MGFPLLESHNKHFDYKPWGMSVISTPGLEQIIKTQEAPTPLLLGFLLVSLTLAIGVAISPRRMLKILSLGQRALEQRTAQQLSPAYLTVLRALAVSVAMGLVVQLIRWAVTGVAP